MNVGCIPNAVPTLCYQFILTSVGGRFETAVNI
jgi:hypothetical protein